MAKVCAVLVLTASVFLIIQVNGRSLDLVRDTELELPANEKISKRDVSSQNEEVQVENLPKSQKVEEKNTAYDTVSKITEELQFPAVLEKKSREKRFLPNTAFPLNDVMGRL